jgi:hypothetical protein
VAEDGRAAKIMVVARDRDFVASSAQGEEELK